MGDPRQTAAAAVDKLRTSNGARHHRCAERQHIEPFGCRDWSGCEIGVSGGRAPEVALRSPTTSTCPPPPGSRRRCGGDRLRHRSRRTNINRVRRTDAPVAGIVLVGGGSSRMGTGKATLEWHGSTLLHRTASVLIRSVTRRGAGMSAGAHGAGGDAGRGGGGRRAGVRRACRRRPQRRPRRPRSAATTGRRGTRSSSSCVDPARRPAGHRCGVPAAPWRARRGNPPARN